MKELKLLVEELEERIAPAFVITPPGGGNGPEGEVGPEPGDRPTKGGVDPGIANNPKEGPSERGAWNAHDHADPVVEKG